MDNLANGCSIGYFLYGVEVCKPGSMLVVQSLTGQAGTASCHLARQVYHLAIHLSVA